MSEKGKIYDKEFKFSAVKLVLESETRVESIASVLGVKSVK